MSLMDIRESMPRMTGSPLYDPRNITQGLLVAHLKLGMFRLVSKMGCRCSNRGVTTE